MVAVNPVHSLLYPAPRGSVPECRVCTVALGINIHERPHILRGALKRYLFCTQIPAVGLLYYEDFEHSDPSFVDVLHFYELPT